MLVGRVAEENPLITVIAAIRSLVDRGELLALFNDFERVIGENLPARLVP